jgi:acetoin utilization deacetylase AcuC-like enzyme
MKVYYTDTFGFELPEGHRFPLEKYGALRTALLASPESEQLDFRIPDRAKKADLIAAHDPAYVSKVMDGGLSAREIRRMGLPWSPELAERSLRSVGGTLSAGRSAMEEGIACSLAGGTHHAGAAHGEGFCVFNDVAIAGKVFLGEQRIARAAVIDCDVHQGNGTAAILAQSPELFTFSIHGQKNFPYRKNPSDLDIGLPDGTVDADYLDMLDQALTRVFLRSRPDLVFYLAGADPHHGDSLGRLAMTKEGLLTRDRLVLEACEQRGLPIVIVLSGGYGRDIQDTVAIHYSTVREALSYWKRRQHTS